MEEATGTLCTQFLCPYCDEEVVVEGDANGEEIECDNCQKIFLGIQF